MPDGMTPNAIEYQLKEYIKPEDLKLSAQTPSDAIRFMQAGLNALGYQGPVDGLYSPDFQQNLNGFIIQKQQEKVGVVKGFLGDNHTVVTAVQGVSGIGGTHVAAISDSLYEGGVMVPGLQVQLLGALKQINHPMINSYTKGFEHDLRDKGVAVSEKAAVVVPSEIDPDLTEKLRLHHSAAGKPFKI